MKETTPPIDCIAFIGFGEAAQAFLKGWRGGGDFAARVVAYDIKTDSPDPAVRAGKRADYAAAHVEGAHSAPEAVAEADAVFSLVTADQAREAGLAAAPGLGRDALYFDGNSCAPQTKARTAVDIERAGARYVDLAVMAPVHPKLHHTPLLISGPHAQPASAALAALDMKPGICEGPVGAASSTKMIRSIMVKGLEALVCECVLAGERAGVIDAVIDSLDQTFPGFNWRKRAAYMFERVMTHGVRRAAEMREVALTVDLLGLEGAMSRGSVAWQQRIGDLKLDAKSVDASDYHALAKLILMGLETNSGAAEKRA